MRQILLIGSVENDGIRKSHMKYLLMAITSDIKIQRLFFLSLDHFPLKISEDKEISR